MLKATETIKQRVILIGNAAHTLHPIAAQGLNLALYEAAFLVDFLLNNNAEREVFSPKQDFSKNLSHHLSWIFSSDFFLLNRLREVSMIALDLSTIAKEFFVNSLAQSVAVIAAAFYPRPVIVRFSDFKSNEYRNLVGGKYFEPHEENPMLGFRGAARYTSSEYAPAFKLECEAIKKARQMAILPYVTDLLK